MATAYLLWAGSGREPGRGMPHCMRSLIQTLKGNDELSCKTKIYPLRSKSNKIVFVLRSKCHIQTFNDQEISDSNPRGKHTSRTPTGWPPPTHPPSAYSPLLHPPNRLSVRFFYFGFLFHLQLYFVLELGLYCCNLVNTRPSYLNLSKKNLDTEIPIMNLVWVVLSMCIFMFIWMHVCTYVSHVPDTLSHSAFQQCQ